MSRLGLAAELAATVPVGRDEARQAAERELSKGMYHADQPGPVERTVERVLEWIANLLDRASGAAPGGGLGLVVLALLIVALAVLVMWRTGPLRRGARRAAPAIELSGRLDPEEHRQQADAHAAAGRYAEAVRERMRAIVRELETRGVLEPRPGRTADEVAAEAGALVPTVAADLRTAASVFDEIWFGGRPANAQADALLRKADQRLRRAQLTVPAITARATGGSEVPR
ncbi:MAG TPA: DUF4129 domain-containing protein [Mycobacteriales bacterium]|nr:DUF4129 domain-containing protein [Mycobacteriales bacterium]